MPLLGAISENGPVMEPSSVDRKRPGKKRANDYLTETRQNYIIVIIAILCYNKSFNEIGGIYMSNAGKTCKVHYTGTFNNGEKFDSSYDRGEPIEFVCGAGMMIKGFDDAVKDMEIGQIVDIHLMPEEAYGMPEPDNILTIEISQLPGSEELSVGQRVYLSNAAGQPFPVTVTAKDDKNITLDANHEMAGKELNFKIELVEVN